MAKGPSGAHRPHPRRRPGCCADHGTVPAGEEGGMAFHPQAAIGADSAIGIQRQSSPCQPGRALASGAEQAGSACGGCRRRSRRYWPVAARPWTAGSSCPLCCCSCSSRCGQRRRSARTTSRPAAPAPITRRGRGSLGSSLSRKESEASNGLMGTPEALGRLTAPTSRLSQSKWSAGRSRSLRQFCPRCPIR